MYNDSVVLDLYNFIKTEIKKVDNNIKNINIDADVSGEGDAIDVIFNELQVKYTEVNYSIYIMYSGSTASAARKKLEQLGKIIKKYKKKKTDIVNMLLLQRTETLPAQAIIEITITDYTSMCNI